MKTRANEFDELVGKLQMEKALELSVGDSVLELGCGFGQYTAMLGKKFKRIVGVDLSGKNIKYAKKNIKSSKYQFFMANAEEFNVNRKFDTILMLSLLEHVNNPISLLKNSKKLLSKKGRIIIEVPNAYSFNRQLAKYMGLINDEHFLPKEQISFFGHKRVYDIDLLKKHIKSAGLSVVKWGGLVFKPFTNDQMQLIINKKSVRWKNKFMSGLSKIGERFPAECTMLYTAVTHLK